MTATDCTILSIGAELLLGLTVDTNAAYMARALLERGWRVREIRIVDDDVDAVATAIRETAPHSRLLLMTGGLGPTDDDRTRDALAAVLQRPLEERPELVAQIEARFRAIGRPMRPVNRVQARIPAGTAGIPNPGGTAPGIHARLGETELFALPGVPREMKQMLADSVLPRLPAPARAGATRIRRLHCIGLGESTVGEIVRPWMQPGTNPACGTTVHHGIITVRFLAQAQNDAEADDLLDKAEATVAPALGDHIFGRDGATLPHVLVSLLRERGETLALAESCTGGMMASHLVDIPGASAVLVEGLVTYANEAKIRALGVDAGLIETHGAVSAPVVSAMAAGARERTGANWALAVSGVAGPDGGTPDKPVGTVWLALAGASGIVYTQHCFASDRTGNRVRAMHVGFELLRRQLLSIPDPESWNVQQDNTGPAPQPGAAS